MPHLANMLTSYKSQWDVAFQAKIRNAQKWDSVELDRASDICVELIRRRDGVDVSNIEGIEYVDVDIDQLDELSDAREDRIARALRDAHRWLWKHFEARATMEGNYDFRCAIQYMRELNEWSWPHPQYGHIEAWDLSNVTVIYKAFVCEAAFNEPIGAWDVSAVVSMKDVFLRDRRVQPADRRLGRIERDRHVGHVLGRVKLQPADRRLGRARRPDL